MMKNDYLNLEKAIELGEYQPLVLEEFAEFKKLSRYSQFQLIKKALKNRQKQLWMHWADINNQLNFSKKPYLQTALRNLEEQIDKLDEDEERLLIEYSG